MFKFSNCLAKGATLLLLSSAFIATSDLDLLPEPQNVIYASSTSFDFEDAETMLELARGYESGKTGEINPKKAFEWYKKSANAGNLVAMLALERCYKTAMGVEYDYQEGEKWSENFLTDYK